VSFHHLHTRKRIYKRLDTYPSSGFKKALDYIMYAVAVVTPLALLPQVVQVFTTKDAAGLSLATWFLLGCINLLWITYAWVHKEKPILVANVLVAFLNFTLVYGIVLYR